MGRFQSLALCKYGSVTCQKRRKIVFGASLRLPIAMVVSVGSVLSLAVSVKFKREVVYFSALTRLN